MPHHVRRLPSGIFEVTDDQGTKRFVPDDARNEAFRTIVRPAQDRNEIEVVAAPAPAPSSPSEATASSDELQSWLIESLLSTGQVQWDRVPAPVQRAINAQREALGKPTLGRGGRERGQPPARGPR